MEKIEYWKCGAKECTTHHKKERLAVSCVKLRRERIGPVKRLDENEPLNRLAKLMNVLSVDYTNSQLARMTGYSRSYTKIMCGRGERFNKKALSEE